MRASVGLPLTLRQKVRQFAVVTGASADGPSISTGRRWRKPGQAFAIYMGVRSARPFPRQAARRRSRRRRRRWSSSRTERCASERAIATELGHLGRAIDDLGIKGPAMIFVGLDWAAPGCRAPDKVELYEPQPRARATRRSREAPARRRAKAMPEVVGFAALKGTRDDRGGVCDRRTAASEERAVHAGRHRHAEQRRRAHDAAAARWLAGFFAGFEAAQGGQQLPQAVAPRQAARSR